MCWLTNVAFGLPAHSTLFHISAAETAYPISFSLFGYILGSWLNSNLVDYAWRKLGIFLETVFLSTGCLGCTFANGLWRLVLWRFVTGMGIGAEIAIVSTYIGELSPASMRGHYTGIANMFSFIGLACLPIMALWLVPNFSWGWRAMFGAGAWGILTLFALPLLPESPRWLLSKGRLPDALMVIEAAEAHFSKRGRPLPAARRVADGWAWTYRRGGGADYGNVALRGLGRFIRVSRGVSAGGGLRRGRGLAAALYGFGNQAGHWRVSRFRICAGTAHAV